MNAQEFQRKCKGHDWSYNFSDSFDVWERCQPVQSEIEAVARQAVKDGNEEILSIWIQYCFLPWNEKQVIKEYLKVRAKVDQEVGEEARMEWEKSTEIHPLYRNVARYKQGWWWLCELTKWVSEATGKTVYEMGGMRGYVHLHENI